MQFIIIFILLFILWLSINYTLLKMRQYNAEKAFNHVFKVINTQYGAVQEFLNSIRTVYDNNNLIDKVIGYIITAGEFTVEKDGNERIIGYANAVFENTNNIKNEVANKENNDENIINALQKYESILKNFNKEKDAYNSAVKKFRHYVDVFPTSLMSRLKKIRTIDYIK